MVKSFLFPKDQPEPGEPSHLDHVLAEGMAVEAGPHEEKLEPLKDRQRRLATYLSKMTNQALLIMVRLAEKESVKHEAEEDRKTLDEILQYLQKPTKAKTEVDAEVVELQEKLNKIAEKYGLIEDYSQN